MPTYYLSLGSNLGDRLAHLQQAARELAKVSSALSAAPIDETAPLDCEPGVGPFFNTVLRIATPLSPEDLHQLTLRLEAAAGRPHERIRNAERPLDIDLILTDGPPVSTPQLVIPHPRMSQRSFVLTPLHDIAPELAQPMLSQLQDASSVTLTHKHWLPFAPYPLRNLSALPLRKKIGPALSMLTAYDHPTARMQDEAGVDIILVGDSLGMVVLGLPDTTHVTMDHMLHHVTAAARGTKRAPIVADLPYRSYLTPGQAAHNAQQLIRAGAHAVKLEGGVSQQAQLKAIAALGIPLVGHIGMLPQSILEEGGKYRKKGRTQASADALMADAIAIQAAGAIAIVMESIIPDVAKAITHALKIPTIGIGSGTATDGQVVVIHDLLGLFPWFRPPFAQPQADLAPQISAAVQAFAAQTRRDHQPPHTEPSAPLPTPAPQS